MAIPCQVLCPYILLGGVVYMNQLAKIYKLTNTVNGYIYIGQTVLSIEERMERHMKCARKNDKRLLYQDIKKYGLESFDIEVVDKCFERHKFIVEEYWYNYYLNKGEPMYEIKKGAKHSKNTRQRLAKARVKNGFDYSSDEFKDTMSKATSGENNGMFNKKDENAVNGRIVVAYDKKGNVAHKFVSVKMALNFLGLKGHNGLNKACRTGEEYYGYFWKKEWINR